MNEKFTIQSYSRIRNNEIWLNGKSVFKQDPDDFPSFIKAAYKSFETDYGKFFKMDNLSKLAAIASDVLLTTEEEKNLALVFSNKASSLDTDRKHHAAMETYPSPAVFVYTLPNICLGEISIKHQLHSENAFFISERFNADLLFNYTNALLDSNKAEKVLCGWVEFDSENYDAFLYIVSKNGTFAHSKATINRLYEANE